MKPGWKSTEFWLTVALALLGAFVGSGIVPSAHWAVKLAGILTAGVTTALYALGRGIAKGGAVEKTAEENSGTKARLGLMVLFGLLIAPLSGCCSSIFCHLTRAQAGLTAASPLAVVALDKACTPKIAACGKVPAAQCPAFATCKAAAAGLKAGLGIAQTGLGQVYRALWEVK